MVYSQILILDSSEVFENSNPNITGSFSDFQVRFDKPLILPQEKPVYVALVKGSTFYSWNIVSTLNNNNLIEIVKTGAGSINFRLEDGIYDTNTLNERISVEIANAFAEDPENSPITLVPDFPTSRVKIVITNPNFSIHLNAFGSLFYKLLGWGENQNKNVTETTIAQNVADITFGINQYLVNCDITSQSVINNNVNSSVIYTFVPNVEVGSSVMIGDSGKNIYLPVSSGDKISRIRIWITDQNGRKIEFKESLTVFLHLTDQP
jgi:hypothetical protein